MVTKPLAKRLGVYTSPDLGTFQVAELQPRREDAWALTMAIEGMQKVWWQSWRSKFVPTHLSEQQLATTVPTVRELVDRMYTGRARYLAAIDGQDGIGHYSQVLGFARVARRHPWRSLLLFPHLTITNLEVRGDILKEYAIPGSALALHALAETAPTRKVTAYTELPNEDGIDFYEQAGFHRTGDETADDNFPLGYVYLEAPQAFVVQQNLDEMLADHR
jgi:hypothetical protein